MQRITVPLAKVMSVVTVWLLVALGLGGCGFDAQTLHGDSPGQGVNVDANAIAIRDLVLVMTSEQTARLSGAVVSPESDTLTEVDGYPIIDEQPGEEFSVSGTPLTIGADHIVNLTHGEDGIMVSSPDLRAGYEAKISLEFASGSQATTRVIVLDTESAVFSSVSPVPTPTRSAAPTGSPASTSPVTSSSP